MAMRRKLISRREFTTGLSLAGAAAQLGIAPAFASDSESIAQIEQAARKEGVLVWYAAMRSEHIDLLSKLFMKDYPDIKVRSIHLFSADITARVLTEQRGRQYNADILSAAAYAISQLKSQKMLQQFTLPEEARAGLTKGSYDPQGYWVSQYALTFPISYNTNKLHADGLKVPTSFEDFTKPEWKGKFAVSSDYYDWYEGFSDAMGREKARDLATRMAANNPMIRGSSDILLQFLEAGEYDATFQVYGYNTHEDRAKGKPVAFANVSPVVVTLQTGGIALHAPHLNAARLFQIWMARRETQQFIATTLGRTSTHEGVQNESGVWEPKKADFVILDPDKQVTVGREFQKEYDRIFSIRR